MTDETSNAIPKLLKARQRHSRVFAVFALVILFCSKPLLPPHAMTRELMVWAGYVLVIIGVFGRVYCTAFIGGRKNDTIVREGMYSVVRNPLYVFSFLATLGIGLQSGMWVMAIVLAGAYSFYYPLVVAKEENFLRHKFGEAYETYLREVPRWWPKWSLWHEPEQVEAKPKFVRRTMFDASLFFLAMPAYALVAALQSQGILPVWLILP